MDKYVFLDIDGVLTEIRGVEYVLSPSKQELLGWILSETEAKIVISSSWRHSTVDRTIEYMYDNGFMFCNDIVGITIRAYHYVQDGVHLSIPRGVEIKQWLDINVTYPWIAHPERDEEFKIRNEDGSFKMMRSQKLGIDYNYVILDDDSDMLLEQADHFVHCDSRVGLTAKDVEKAIKILS